MNNTAETTTNNDVELLPCPMCNEEPEYHFVQEEEFDDWDTHSYICYRSNHHSVQAIGLSKEDAIKAWNARVPQKLPGPDSDVVVDYWPDNICADRNETTGKWNLAYLTDEQANACQRAIKTYEEARRGK